MLKFQKSVPLLLTAIGVMGAIGFLTMTEARAASVGCCMKRADTTEGTPWKKISTDIRFCKRENENPPDNKDNILKPIGQIWWNVQCQN